MPEIQHAQNQVANGTSVTVTLPKPTGVGNTVVVLITCSTSTAGQLSCKLGGVTDNFASDVNLTNAAAGTVTVWSDPNAASGQTAVLVSLSTGSQLIIVDVYEYPGVLAKDQTVTNAVSASGAGTWTTTATPTTTVTPEVAFGMVGGFAATAVTPPAAWTNLTFQSPDASSIQQTGYLDVFALQTVTYNGSTNSANLTYNAALVTYKGVRTPPAMRNMQRGGKLWRRLNQRPQRMPPRSPLSVTATVPGTNGASVKVLALTGATEAGGVSNANEVLTGVAASWSMTPNGSNSLPCFVIYDETGGTNGEFTAATNNTLDDNSFQHDAFCDGRYTGTVTAGTPITVGTTNTSATKRDWASYEVLASGGSTPVIDGSTPPVAISAAGIASTVGFFPPSGAVLVALVTGNTTGTTETVVDSWGLTWTLRSSFNGGGGIVAVFTATVPGGVVSSDVSVNAAVATVGAVAPDAGTAIRATAGVATSAAVANQPVAALGALAGIPIAAAAALASSTDHTANAVVATSASTVTSPIAAITRAAVAAAVTATSNPPVPAVAGTPIAAVIGSAALPPSTQVTLSAAVATSAAVASPPVPAVAVLPAAAVVGVVGNAATVSTAGAANAPAAVALVGVVANPPSTAVTVNAGVASVGSAATPPVVAAGVNAGVAASGAVSNPASTSITTNATVGVVGAAVTGARSSLTTQPVAALIGSVANPASPAITVNAGVAVVLALGNAATVSTSSSVNATAGVATVGAVSAGPTTAVTATSPAATATSAAAQPVPQVTATAGVATALGVSPGALGVSGILVLAQVAAVGSVSNTASTGHTTMAGVATAGATVNAAHTAIAILAQVAAALALGNPVSLPLVVFKLGGLQAGAPHRRWAVGPPRTLGWETGAPRVRYTAASAHSRYAAGSPHGRWQAGPPHD